MKDIKKEKEKTNIPPRMKTSTELWVFLGITAPVSIFMGMAFGRESFYLLVVVSLLGFVLISRPIFQKERKELLWVGLMCLLAVFLGFICYNPVESVYRTWF